MNTTTKKPAMMDTYRIVPSMVQGFFLVEMPDFSLMRTKQGLVRRFKSRAGARKAITRQRRGDFHR